MTNVRSVALIRFVICVSIILALIFLVISTSTNHWYFQPIIATKNQSVEVNSGIFQKCYHVKEVKSYNCLSTKFNGFMIAFRLFLFTGIVGYSVLLIYVLFSSFFQEVNFKVLSVMLILTGLSVMIALLIFTGVQSRHGENIKFQWSFYLGWLSFIFTVKAGALCCFGTISYQKI
ncbi:claudin domain-containing protein 2 isoform X1 [Hydra vulgaris]|uniref:claudin domain-containing protein 2 isoform X1 n=1 Tax=Hydra vulgaris TaxID=6087 RepID=UPI001F5FB14A|nr:claudin domain-containing protein 2 isoform X2 [Hydra vulgaris]